jgi:indole-3-glycerol phosphate synthase/phosphoribosylanthranilate isomerase
MIMDEIIARKRQDLHLLVAPKTLKPSTQDFLKAIMEPGLQVIAEVKEKSPSTGVLCVAYQPEVIAQEYKKGGAAAISVLTDIPYFGGQMTDLTKVKQATDLPVLCKDFIISEIQIEVARHYGADAVLLIVRVLDVETLKQLKVKIESLNMLALIEIFDEADLEKALLVDPKVLMINHRDLDTLKVDCATSNALIDKIPAGIPVVAASGIMEPKQALEFDARIKAVLIGTALLKSSDAAEFIRALKNEVLSGRREVDHRLGHGPKVKICGITNLEDALLCERLGADYLGFIFEESSKRCIDYAKARSIIARLTTAKAVGVFVKQEAQEIHEVAEDLKLAAVQVYQDFDLSPVPFEVIRVLRVKEAQDFLKIQILRDKYSRDFILLDTYHEQQLGGTGQCFDWRLLPKDLSRCFLSGGIRPENVIAASAYQPFGLDLASGVEVSPGKKDAHKVKKLFEELHHGT